MNEYHAIHKKTINCLTITKKLLLLKEEAKDDDTSRAVNNLVSVIVPTMNSGKTLHKCLESTRSQSYGDIEIIVIDGHSSDNTTEIASKFNAKILVTTD